MNQMLIGGAILVAVFTLTWFHAWAIPRLHNVSDRPRAWIPISQGLGALVGGLLVLKGIVSILT